MRAPSISTSWSPASCRSATIRPATYIGNGKVDEIAGLVKSLEAGVVVIDCALSPVQQRNLEKAWNAKVLDRTGLILEIFGRRAAHQEGALQVELAHLTYQRSRLVRTWTHLERQRGGFGFLGGPGETQIETDRRLIGERIARIETELEKVKKRAQAAPRQPRARAVSDRGAGRLHQRRQVDAVQPPDAARACCKPTCCSRRSIRRCARCTCRAARKIILSDTVGFISDLPTMLVAAFRATLEEVIEADVILHVRDVSHDDTEAQSRDVEEVLRALGIEPNEEQRLIEVWNKIDRLDADGRTRLAKSRRAAARRSAAGAGVGADRGGRRRAGQGDRSAARRCSRVVLDLVARSGRRRRRELAPSQHRGDGEIARRRTARSP